MKLFKKIWYGNQPEERIKGSKKIRKIRWHEKGAGEPLFASIITMLLVGFLFEFNLPKLLATGLVTFYFYYSIDRAAFEDGCEYQNRDK